MPILTVNRAKLAEYIVKNIDVLLENAEIDLDGYDTIVSPAEMQFNPKVQVRIENIPFSEVEGDPDGKQQ